MEQNEFIADIPKIGNNVDQIEPVIFNEESENQNGLLMPSDSRQKPRDPIGVNLFDTDGITSPMNRATSESITTSITTSSEDPLENKIELLMPSYLGQRLGNPMEVNVLNTDELTSSSISPSNGSVIMSPEIVPEHQNGLLLPSGFLEESMTPMGVNISDIDEITSHVISVLSGSVITSPEDPREQTYQYLPIMTINGLPETTSYQRERKWRCDFCEKESSSERIIVRHKLSHNGVKPLRSQPTAMPTPDGIDCNATAATVYGVNRSTTQRHECAECILSFSRANNLHHHKLHKHRTIEQCILEHSQPPKVDKTAQLHSKMKRCNPVARSLRSYSSKTLVHGTSRFQQKNKWKCDHCGKVLIGPESLKRHKLSHRSFKCRHCSKDCGSSKSLKDHERGHVFVKSHKSSECNLSLTNTKSPRRHNLLNQPYIGHRLNKYPQSPKACRNKALLVARSNRKPSTARAIVRETYGLRQRKTLTYEVCADVLTNPTDLKRRKLIHRSFKCRHCDEEFSSSESLADHEQSHSLVKLHECSECNRSYANAKNLHRHISLRHSEVENPMIEFTQGTIATIDVVKRVRFCTDDTTPINCGDGSVKTSPTKSCLTNHKPLNGCNNNRRYMRQYCDKSYATTHQFKQHIAIEHGDGDQRKEHNFECRLCGKILLLESKLLKHMTIHRGIKQVDCFVCFKSFTTKSGLRQHAVIHSGLVKPFECVSCGKSFWWKGSLVSHSKSHKSPIQKLRIIRGAVLPYTCDDWLELSVPGSVIRIADALTAGKLPALPSAATKLTGDSSIPNLHVPSTAVSSDVCRKIILT